MLPTIEAEPERYIGRPLLIVIENYILAAIGELPTERHAGLAKIVQTVFGGESDWMETVRQQLQLGRGFNTNLQKMWQANQATAFQNGVTLHPIQFAKMVADANFASLIGPPL